MMVFICFVCYDRVVRIIVNFDQMPVWDDFECTGCDQDVIVWKSFD